MASAARKKTASSSADNSAAARSTAKADKPVAAARKTSSSRHSSEAVNEGDIKPGHKASARVGNSHAAPSQGTRVIKKYPNRRLYDTHTSTYITLAEVKALVLQSEPISVLDAKTGDDLTRSIFLQIILEEEAGGAPMFTEAVLANIIRFYGHAMQGVMGSYLEKNVQLCTDFQNRLTETGQVFTPEMWTKMLGLPKPGMPAMPGMLGNYAEQSGQMLTQMQEQLKKQTEQMMGVFGLKR